MWICMHGVYEAYLSGDLSELAHLPLLASMVWLQVALRTQRVTDGRACGHGWDVCTCAAPHTDTHTH